MFSFVRKAEIKPPLLVSQKILKSRVAVAPAPQPRFKGSERALVRRKSHRGERQRRKPRRASLKGGEKNSSFHQFIRLLYEGE